MKRFLSSLIALIVIIGLGLWMLTGELIISGSGEGTSHTQLYFAKDCDISDESCDLEQKASEAEKTEKKREMQSDFRVRVQSISSEPHVSMLSLKGRSGANAIVTHRAETSASITEVHVVKGQKVSKGDLLCALDEGARKVTLQQAQSALKQAKFELDNGENLFLGGHISTNRLQQLRVAKDSAEVAVKNAELEISHMNIYASVNGIVSDDLANKGDLLTIGGVCASVVELHPLLAITQLPEYELGNIQLNEKATVKLITGEEIRGEISYISPVSDPQTRTFRTEITLDNSDYKLRDGVTATINIMVDSDIAYLIPAIAVTLSQNGEIGVKIVSDDHQIQFIPLTLFSQSREGIWGRPKTISEATPSSETLEDLNVIIVGQDYVLEGEYINPDYVEFLKQE